MTIFWKLLTAILIILSGFFLSSLILISINTNTLSVNKISRQSLKTLNEFSNLYYEMNTTLIKTEPFDLIHNNFINSMDRCNKSVKIIVSMKNYSDSEIEIIIEKIEILWKEQVHQLDKANVHLINIAKDPETRQIAEIGIMGVIENGNDIPFNMKPPIWNELVQFRQVILNLNYSIVPFRQNLTNLTIQLDNKCRDREKISFFLFSSIAVFIILFAILFVLLFSRNLTGKFSRINTFLNNILNSMPAIIISTDSEGRIVRMNPVAEKLTGWQFDKAQGKPLNEVLNIVHAITHETVESPVNKVLTSGGIVSLSNHTMLISKDGVEYHITDSGAPIRDNKGNITGVVMVFRDITEKYKLREQYRNMAFLVESASSPIVMSTLEGKLSYVNPAFLKTWGYDRPGEVIGHSITEFWLIEERITEILNTMREKGSIIEESRARKRDGTLFYVQVSAATMHDDTGKPIGLMSSSLDITERNHLRNYLSSIIDSMPSMLVGVDGDGKVTQWNRKAEQTTGISACTAYGRILSDVFPQMTTEMKNVFNSIRSGEVKQEQKKPRTTDKGTCFEDVTIYPLIADGIEGAVIRIDDVTEKAQMEEMMIQGEKMLSVGGLAAGMAHEINNPLAGMIHTASVMSRRLGENPDFPANQKAAEEAGTTMEVIWNFMEARGIPRMLANISESGRRVAEIVGNMLSFARKSEKQSSSNDLAELLDKTLKLASTDYDLKKQYDFRQIKIRKEYDKGLPPVICEAAKIQQVLLNLLRNGAQAMQENETVKPLFTLRTLFEKERKMAVIEVEDNGPGMNEEIRKRIFEPFFTTKTVGEGIGLGLSVSYFIITENHGGEMSVESQPGEGTKFIIRLPIEGYVKV